MNLPTLTDVVASLLAWVGGALGLGTLSGLVPLVVYVLDALIIVMLVIFPVVTVVIWLLRKVMGFIQRRLGPMRTGPVGVFQTIADAIKLFHKEDIIPASADRAVFLIAPFLVFVPAVMLYVVIPFGKGGFITKDLNVGLVYLTAISSITAVGLITAGWSSDNRWALLGGLRSAAQLVSYELPMTLALLGPPLMAGTLSLAGIVEAQKAMWFVVPQALGFLIYFIAGLAEVSHLPFDLPEAESELVAGYNVEYSGMRFGLFFLGEFANGFTVCLLASVLFLGGWHLLPGLSVVDDLPGWQAGIAAVVVYALFFGCIWLFNRRYAGLTSATDWTFKWGTIPAAILAGIVLVAGLLGFISVVVTLMKASMLVFVLMWLRGTLPRVRVDQLMGFAWKVLVPLGLLNFLALGFQAATGFPSGWILNGLFLLGLVLLVVFGWRRRWAYSHV